ncbi:hypothetical protein PIB30_087359 [Stylosanthes scabra]|uniref:Putative plant transposon protein domain-containing protein n=1 Tax=Stylosanthes scabra TaxID=79078 RepID=A0ABU6TSW0_9FABA|nr:hypothetical protein [Stylosanthes scabra]
MVVGESYENNDLDLDKVMRVIGKYGATWPSLPGRISKNILNKEAWIWMKLAVCNMVPTRHETTLGVDHILLIYALMKRMTISLPAVMATAKNDDPTKSKRQLLPFPIGKIADEDPIPPPVPAPAPPPATRTDIPAPSTSNSPQPSRKELMRALSHNERIMRRHEQLLLMFHPSTDISQLEHISSPEVSEHQQQAAGDLEDEASSNEDGSDEDSSEE